MTARTGAVNRDAERGAEVRLEHVNMIATIGDEDTAAASSSRVLFQRYVLIGLNILNKWI